MTTKDYNPNTATHPGNTLKEILENLGMSQTDLAERAGLTLKTINEIVQGKNPVTPETAIRFAAVFGMSANFWNNLERNYQETLARIEQTKKLEKEIPFMQQFSCYKELSKWKYVPASKDPKEKVCNLLNFFGVSSLEFVQKTHAVAFRKSNKENLSHESLAAWLRCGEIEASKIETKPFDKEKLLQSIELIRQLTDKNPSQIEHGLRAICAEAGIAVAFVPYFPNTYVDGATRWISSEKALIQVSLRGSHIDSFWFTFFHEIGHLLKHGKKDQFVEFEKQFNSELEEKEREANEFAGKTLIPEANFRKFMNTERIFSDNSINMFARSVGISSAIVAGRVARELHQNGDMNAWKKFSHLRKTLKFAQPAI
jgi:HTH-type transcriptional regulator/antitoxin HigA